jgi:hypothetical protein
LAKKRKRNLKWKEARLEDFSKAAVSLGDLFEELASLHPDLTIGRTTSKRDVGFRLDDSFADGKKHGNKLILWHGTTEDRAKAIIEEGFRKAQVWFTSKLPVAQRMAINRARQRSDVPVVISCEIDLEKYPSFGRPDPKTYVFYSPTGKEIIGGVTLGKDIDDPIPDEEMLAQVSKHLKLES